jgi:ribosomal protein L14
LQNTTVFAGFSYGVGWKKRSGENLHIIENATLTAVRCVNEILDVHVRTYAGVVDPDFILMDVNTREHRAHITNQYLEEAIIVRMDWPARSPDFVCLFVSFSAFFQQYLRHIGG